MEKLEKRLELRLDAKRIKLLEEESSRTGVSMAELIRRAIDSCYQPRDLRIEQKLKALEELGMIGAPTASPGRMKDEIAAGMLGKRRP